MEDEINSNLKQFVYKFNVKDNKNCIIKRETRLVLSYDIFEAVWLILSNLKKEFKDLKICVEYVRELLND